MKAVTQISRLIDSLAINTIFLHNAQSIDEKFRATYYNQVFDEYMQLPESSKALVILEYTPIGLQIFMSL